MPSGLVVTVIPNWNLREDLCECLESLRFTTYKPHHVIVVDNGSTDDSVAFVAANYPEVELIALTKNWGYAAALNAGIVRALDINARYVFALNNDTIVPPDTITQLVQILETDNMIGIVAPKSLIHSQPTHVYSLGDRIYSWLPLPLGFGYNQKDRPAFGRIMDFDYVTGCAMLIRSEVFQKIGFFDTGFFLYYEDSDFCRRTRDAGFRIICAGQTIIYHKVSQSTNKNRPASLRIRARNRVRFYRRYRHGPTPALTIIALALIALWRIVSYVFTGQANLIAPYLLGLWEGWREGVIPPEYYRPSAKQDTSMTS